jgi:hypothetical protein
LSLELLLEVEAVFLILLLTVDIDFLLSLLSLFTPPFSNKAIFFFTRSCETDWGLLDSFNGLGEAGLLFSSSI